MEPNRNETIAEAYRKIYKKDPDPEIEEWRLASEIIDHWNVPALGEDLAMDTLERIILYTGFPSEVLIKKVVGEAEEKARELLSEIGDRDAHWDLLAELFHKRREQREISIKNSELTNNRR